MARPREYICSGLASLPVEQKCTSLIKSQTTLFQKHTRCQLSIFGNIKLSIRHAKYIVDKVCHLSYPRVVFITRVYEQIHSKYSLIPSHLEKRLIPFPPKSGIR